ncbi:hypothetical protein [Mycobacterium sp. 1274756.6]|uniref:hypothetical protein n=1 Tax=Mycobacterium sp. 1274756.6 TaxID=1834076 RepID=UPI0007FDE5AC|nr:hypothetical protein [Mycobacterium sp. 1274756.6]OBJ70990.1 hypothetical protein A5643_08855 [Mycobacterium sp. 1274756.6]
MSQPVNLAPVLRAVGDVAGQLATLQGDVGRIDANVGSISTDLQTTRSELNQLRDDFQQFIQQAERTANVQRSETKIGNVEAALEREFGHYKVVRRTSIGILQAFDIGNVSDRTVQQVSEELMIQTPRYWLAPALVALAAWSRDNRNLAERSVEAAFTRDPQKTSLFFALILRRQRRMEASTRWLRHYLSSLDPRALTREFVVILEAASQDAFGPQGRALMGAQLSDWNEKVRNEPGVAGAQVETWVKELSIHRATVDDALYPHLAKVCPQWSKFKDLLEQASALEFVAHKYSTVRDTETPLALSIQERLDDILELLVTEFDTEELPFQRDVVYHRAVIDNGGDLDRAREAADALNEALDETLDVVSLQTQTAIRPQLFGASVAAQKVAIDGGRGYFRQAIGKYTAAYRARYTDTVDIELDENHSEYAKTLGFPGWQTDTAVTQDEAEASLAAAWRQAVQAYLERIRFKETNYLIAGGIAVVGLLMAIMAFPVGLLLFLAAVGGSAIWLWQKKKTAEEKYREAQEMAQQALNFSVDIYRAAAAEFVDAKIAFRAADEQEAALLTVVDGWPTYNTRQETAS